MDKRNRPALAYLLVGVASAGRAMLAMPDAVALQEVSLTVLALVGYLLLGHRALPVLACGTVQLVLELVLCGTLGRSRLAGPAAASRGPVAAVGHCDADVEEIAGYTTGKNAKMPVAGRPCRWPYTALHTFLPWRPPWRPLPSSCSASCCCGTPCYCCAPTTPPA